MVSCMNIPIILISSARVDVFDSWFLTVSFWLSKDFLYNLGIVQLFIEYFLEEELGQKSGPNVKDFDAYFIAKMPTRKYVPIYSSTITV